MKKMKRFFALFLAMAMVLGMSMTVFAEPGTTGTSLSASIIINDAGETAKFNCVQIVERAPGEETGWKFKEGYLQYFTGEGAFAGMDEQTILAGMIYANDSTADKGKEIEGFAGKYAAALKALYNATEDGTATAPLNVTEAGVYFIKGAEEGYTYSPMAAYVGFNKEKYVNGVPTELDDKSLNAKRQKTTITKTTTDTDQVTQIGREVEFNIDSEVPYIPETDAERKFVVTDTITGATYVTVKAEDDAENAGKVEVSVVLAGDETQVKHFYATVDGSSFTVDLSSLLENNANQNKTLKISYKATVTDTKVGNDVKAGDGTNNGDSKYGSSHVDLFTGKIELTKTADTENGASLENAGFKVSLAGTDGTYDANAEKMKFVEVTEGVTTKTYKPSATGEEEVFTGADGKVTIIGLDKAVYFFEETTAPTGYSINDEKKSAEVKLATNVTKAQKQDDVIDGKTSFVDTKLSALPSTGGIGTTIFTVGGCAIMILAAGMFFVSRRRASR